MIRVIHVHCSILIKDIFFIISSTESSYKMVQVNNLVYTCIGVYEYSSTQYYFTTRSPRVIAITYAFKICNLYIRPICLEWVLNVTVSYLKYINNIYH